MIDTTSARHHAIVATLLVALAGGLAAANHVRWKTPSFEDFIATTPAPSDVDVRHFWRHQGGYFEQRGDFWYEPHAQGEFVFVEQARTPEYVELHDSSRNCGVRLSATECHVRCTNFDWTLFYRGGWTMRANGGA